jgi:hypothetical protein
LRSVGFGSGWKPTLLLKFDGDGPFQRDRALRRVRFDTSAFALKKDPGVKNTKYYQKREDDRDTARNEVSLRVMKQNVVSREHTFGI